MDAEEQEEYQQLLLKHKQELEDFERHFNAQIESANPSLKKKLNQRFPKEKNALEERQYEELLPYKLSGLLTFSDTTTTTTTHNKSNNNSHHHHHSSHNNHNSNNHSSNSSKEEQAKQKKRDKNKKKADSKKKKQDEMRKQVQDEFEREGGVTMRMKELQAILNQLNPLHLSIHEIESDGHCLYRAVCHQLLLQSTASKMVNHVENDGQNEDGENDDEHVMIEEKTKTTTINHLQLRKLVANYLRENKNDFIYFMETEDGDIMDDAQYENYCKTVESSSEWGGQIELRAIAFILQKPIRIFQQSQQPILMGEEFVDPSDPEQGVLSVSYHRSYYSLGEHYNSIIETPKEEEPL